MEITMAAKTVKFGIMATGDIARQITETIQSVPGAEVWAVGSRTLEKAQAFAEKHHIPHAYGSYEELVSDPEIDIIHVATPHSQHYENMLLCLEHGKNILCEKSFTVNAIQAKEIFKIAEEKKLFVMEALWLRFNPAINQAIAKAKDGQIGDIRMVNIIFGRMSPDAGSSNDRYNRPKLAGGALLDLGVYTINAAQMIFDEQMPTKIATVGTISEEGIDEQSSIIFQYGKDQTVTMQLAYRSHMTRHFSINVTKGMVEMEYFPRCDNVYVRMGKSAGEKYEVETYANAYEPEIRHVVDCIQKGLTESPIMTHEKTIRTMELMDALRKEWGLKYPLAFEDELFAK